MQIHSLPEQQTVADSDMFALDTGTTTRRTPFSALKTAISDYAHKLTNLTATTTVNDSDVLPIDAGSGAKKITYVNLKNKIISDAAPTYTSGDAENPTAWSNVTVITSGLSLGTLLNRITTMIKNVRWLYGRLGTTDISSLGSTITGAISALSGSIDTTNASLSNVSANALARKNEYLESNTNLNDLTYGIYYLSGSRSYTNLPTGMTWGVLIHIGGQQNCQIMINNSNLAFRAYASSWGNWHILS